MISYQKHRVTTYRISNSAVVAMSSSQYAIINRDQTHLGEAPFGPGLRSYDSILWPLR